MRVRPVGLAHSVMLVLDGDDGSLPLRRLNQQPRKLLVELGPLTRLTVAPISRSSDSNHVLINRT